MMDGKLPAGWEWAAQVESVLAASVARAGRLRQSVLKAAFEGRLL